MAVSDTYFSVAEISSQSAAKKWNGYFLSSEAKTEKLNFFQ